MEILCQTILDFWFSPEPFANSDKWFKKDPKFDELIKKKFGEYIDLAYMGAFDRWTSSYQGLTALIVLLDQFPRNAFRNLEKSFIYDKKALSLSLLAIEKESYLEGHCAYGYFSLMPTMHAEDLDVQNLGIECFKKLHKTLSEPDPKALIEAALDYAVRHRDIIERFNRFPHRNAILGRTSTPEELSFLQEKGSSF